MQHWLTMTMTFCFILPPTLTLLFPIPGQTFSHPSSSPHRLQMTTVYPSWRSISLNVVDCSGVYISALLSLQCCSWTNWKVSEEEQSTASLEWLLGGGTVMGLKSEALKLGSLEAPGDDVTRNVEHIISVLQSLVKKYLHGSLIYILA